MARWRLMHTMPKKRALGSGLGVRSTLPALPRRHCAQRERAPKQPGGSGSASRRGSLSSASHALLGARRQQQHGIADLCRLPTRPGGAAAAAWGRACSPGGADWRDSSATCHFQRCKRTCLHTAAAAAAAAAAACTASTAHLLHQQTLHFLHNLHPFLQQQQQSFVQHAARSQPRPLRRRAGPVLASAEAAAAPQQSAQPPAATAQQQQQQQQPAAASQSSVGVHGALVVVEDMVKHFQTRRGVFKAVNGVDVSMEPGTITALLGPSGSGAQQCLLCLKPPRVAVRNAACGSRYEAEAPANAAVGPSHAACDALLCRELTRWLPRSARQPHCGLNHGYLWMPYPAKYHCWSPLFPPHRQDDAAAADSGAGGADGGAGAV